MSNKPIAKAAMTIKQKAGQQQQQHQQHPVLQCCHLMTIIKEKRTCVVKEPVQGTQKDSR
jgi:hypothetical protein